MQLVKWQFQEIKRCKWNCTNGGINIPNYPEFSLTSGNTQHMEYLHLPSARSWDFNQAMKTGLWSRWTWVYPIIGPQHWMEGTQRNFYRYIWRKGKGDRGMIKGSQATEKTGESSRSKPRKQRKQFKVHRWKASKPEGLGSTRSAGTSPRLGLCD